MRLQLARSSSTHVAAALLLGCGGWEAGDELPGSNGNGAAGASGSCPEEFDPALAETTDALRGFTVVSNRIQDSEGRDVVFRGVNRSGSEYQCLAGGIFDGAVDEEAVRAMARWNINSVRVPLNEACWLGIGNAARSVSGETYRSAIERYVELLQRFGLTPILDLHWARPGDVLPETLWPMPNADHSERFWADVAERFLDNDGVIFEPYNEPFPDRNSNSREAWECWRDGCLATQWSGESYEAVGMQALVDAIRSTGSEHLILLGGVQYSNSLSGWLEHKPDDPIDNLAPAWHVYNFNACASERCWNGTPAELAEQYPIVVTELGQNDCQGEFVQTFLGWLEKTRLSYLAWSWNAYGECSPEMQVEGGNAYPLITSYDCAQPNGGYADVFYETLENVRP